MADYPSKVIPLFNGKAWLSQYPDWRAVKNPATKYPLRPKPWPAASLNHMGVDMYGMGWNPPLYVPPTADGTVVEVNKTGGNGKYGWYNTSGLYVAIKVDGTVGCEVVWTAKHLSGQLVKVGDKVKAGQMFAYEGKTGEASGLHVHCDLFVDGVRWDPTPHFWDGRSFKIKMESEDTVVNLPVIAEYVATDNIKIRNGASLKAAQTGLISKGDKISVTNLKDADGHVWAQHAKGWSALGTADGKTLWVQAVKITDNSAELQTALNKIKTLTSQIAAANGKISAAKKALG